MSYQAGPQGYPPYPQPPYQAPPPVPPDPRRQAQLAERRSVRRGSTLAGLTMLIGILLTFLLSAVLGFPLSSLDGKTIYELFDTPLWDSAVSVLGTAALLSAALIGLRLLRPEERAGVLLFGRPCAGMRGREISALAVIFAGGMFCVVGQYVSTYLGSFAEGIGVTFQGPPDSYPATLPEMIAAAVATAVFPAVTEEVLLRGVLLQPLRRQLGDGPAVLLAALLFALMHGNMVQAPLALVSGVALGYAVVLTGSLWPAILIHFFNNAGAVLSDVLHNRLPESQLDLIFRGYDVAWFVLGGLGIGWLFANWRRYRPKQDGAAAPRKPPRLNSRPLLSVHYLFGSVPMVLVILYYLFWVIDTTQFR
ncbi:MAG: CPBP family intramembrane metalloprotease [Oscillospiraceae bacterium]|nr:CPBP family intramembrane metalloprotease [Oscillospiraceae bacterium]